MSSADLDASRSDGSSAEALKISRGKRPRKRHSGRHVAGPCNPSLNAEVKEADRHLGAFGHPPQTGQARATFTDVQGKGSTLVRVQEDPDGNVGGVASIIVLHWVSRPPLSKDGDTFLRVHG